MIAGDLETTGLLKPDLIDPFLQPHLTEIYFCKFDWDGNIIDEIETFIKPPVPIPEEIVKITGITDEMVSDAPRFIEVYDDLCEFFKGEDTFFAHNCSYEIGCLVNELRRSDLEYRFPWPKNQICTVERTYDIQNKRLKLGTLYEIATGKTMKNAHRAKSDVVQMIECITWMRENDFLSDLP